MYYNRDGIIEIEKSDQCYDCVHYNANKPCPLLEALSNAVVEFNEFLEVSNCSWYEKKYRHLKVVETSE